MAQIALSALHNPLGRLRCLQRADEETDGAFKIALVHNKLAVNELRDVVTDALSPLSRTAQEAVRRVHETRGETDA